MKASSPSGYRLSRPAALPPRDAPRSKPMWDGDRWWYWDPARKRWGKKTYDRPVPIKPNRDKQGPRIGKGKGIPNHPIYSRPQNS